MYSYNKMKKTKTKTKTKTKQNKQTNKQTKLKKSHVVGTVPDTIEKTQKEGKSIIPTHNYVSTDCPGSVHALQ